MSDKQPPKVIYLQWGDDEGIEYFDNEDFITWCVDQINDTDVAYIKFSDVLDCQSRAMEAIRLLNSMVSSGEGHTDQSRSIVEVAIQSIKTTK